MTVSFYNDAGSALSLPVTITNQGATQTTTSASVSATINPNATLLISIGDTSAPLAPMHRPIAASTLSLSFRLGLRPPRHSTARSRLPHRTPHRLRDNKKNRQWPLAVFWCRFLMGDRSLLSRVFERARSLEKVGQPKPLYRIRHGTRQGPGRFWVTPEAWRWRNTAGRWMVPSSAP